MNESQPLRREALVTTAKASVYLQQLCKHWSHKFSVRFDAASGEITFGAATAALAASEGQLRITLGADDPATLDRMQEVVAEHLRRFATKEELAFDWRAASS